MAKADCNHSITATRGSQLLTCPPVHAAWFVLPRDQAAFFHSINASS